MESVSYLQKGKETAKCNYDTGMYSATALEWISEEKVRIPQEKTTVLPRQAPFFAAGKPYLNNKQLCVQKDEAGTWAKDIYGRDVLCICEKYPCFDSYDALTEKRFFRWFFICEDSKLTRIYYADDRKTITITEDVRFLEDCCWREMERLNIWI